MFFTDAPVKPAENIFVHQMSFKDFCSIVQAAFPFSVVLDRPYKLCDYKQAYGYILRDYVKGYDFWGFGDLDLVYGDIRHFLNEDVLRHKFILGWGHLTLLHNDESTNMYFMKRVEGYQYYQDAFTKHEISFFDEFCHRGCSDKWRDCRPEDCWLESPFDNVSRPKEAYHLCSLNRGWQQVLFEHVDNKLFMVRRFKGKWEKTESLYAHFQHRPFMVDSVSNYDHFLVTPRKIRDYPKRFAGIVLRFLCRRRVLMTQYYWMRDYILWRLHLDYQR